MQGERHGPSTVPDSSADDCCTRCYDVCGSMRCSELLQPSMCHSHTAAQSVNSAVAVNDC